MKTNEMFKIAFISALLVIILLTGCSQETQTQTDNNQYQSETQDSNHQHTFDSSWSYNETYHWHNSNCNHDVVSDKQEHLFDQIVVYSPSCTKEGYTEYTCSVCGYTKQSDKVDKIDHSYSINESLSESSPTSAGEVKHQCDMCGFSFVEKTSESILSVDEKGFVSLADNCNRDDITLLAIPRVINGVFIYGISDNAFSNCENLREVSISEGITTIGSYSFCNDPCLYSLSLPDSVEEIGDGAFKNCSNLISVSIPENISKIGDYAFSLCSSLSSFSVAKNNKNYRTIDGVLFNYSYSKLISYPAGKSNPYYGAYSIPKSVVEIGNGAFQGSKIENILINVSCIGDYAFANCSKLQQIVISKKLDKIGKNVFIGCQKLDEVYFDVDSITPTVESPANSLFYGSNPLLRIFIRDEDPASWGYWNYTNDTNKANTIVTNYFVGDIGPSGGLICYIKDEFSDGWRYLEAAPTDTDDKYIFGEYYKDESLNNISTTIGSGYENTELLFGSNAFKNPQATTACISYSLGDYDDFFLPSLDELKEVSKHLGIFSKGDYSFYSNVFYWTSSLSSNQKPYIVCLLSGFSTTTNSDENRCTLPIRRF